MFSRMLVPLDGTTGSNVDRMLRGNDADMILQQVREQAADGHYADSRPRRPSACRYVDRMVVRVHDAGIAADGEARIAPDIAGGIIQAAEEHASDMIVMSANALTGLQRAHSADRPVALGTRVQCCCCIARITRADRPVYRGSKNGAQNWETSQKRRQAKADRARTIGRRDAR